MLSTIILPRGGDVENIFGGEGRDDVAETFRWLCAGCTFLCGEGIRSDWILGLLTVGGGRWSSGLPLGGDQLLREATPGGS